MRESHRRTFLRAVGATGAASLAGCAALSGSDDDTPTDAEPTSEGGSGGESGSESESTDSDSSGPSVITVEGGGADIWNQTDLGHFYYETVTGDFDARVEVTSVSNTHAHAKGGLMARNSMETGAANVFMRRRPERGVSPQWRAQSGEDAASVTSSAGEELARNRGVHEGTWQRLERVGDTVRTYGSSDGEEWTLLAELPANVVALEDEVHLGLAVTSHNQAKLCTAKFRNLDGVEPDANEDIGSPLMPGDVTVDDSVVVAETEEPTDVTATAATLRGRLEGVDGESLTVSFEYREVTEEEWRETDSTTVGESGTVGIDVSGLTARRYYEFRIAADDGDQRYASVEDVFATPSGSGGGTSEGPASASEHDPADGFAEMAPWLDDDTPVVTVSEPTRTALEKALTVDGPRVVVFETSGTIDLGADSISISRDKCWVAGQTAPSPGITLVRGALSIDASDCVVQHVRTRAGDAGQEVGEWEPDSLSTGDDTRNNVVDHCSVTWSVDECLSVGYRSQDTTVSNCLISEPLNDSTHHKGAHGYGSLVGNDAKNVAMMGNVWMHARSRNPRLKTGVAAAVVNNVMYDFDEAVNLGDDTEATIVGNSFRRVDEGDAVIEGGQVYHEDNVTRPETPITNDVTESATMPLWPENLTEIPGADVFEHNLANAGARPADRTEHDQRIFGNLEDNEGEMIDSQTDVGGYPDLPENTEALEVPDSGLRAWLREQAVAVEE